jgi:hypothetical protein
MRRALSIGLVLAIAAVMAIGCDSSSAIQEQAEAAKQTAPRIKPPIQVKKKGAREGAPLPHL